MMAVHCTFDQQNKVKKAKLGLYTSKTVSSGRIHFTYISFRLVCASSHTYKIWSKGDPEP